MRKAFSVTLLVLLFAACQKQQVQQPAATENGEYLPTASIPVSTPNWNPYVVALESKVNNPDGTYTWTWSIRNPAPGNGNSGTAQDLSHWNMPFGSCVNTSSFTSVETSYDGSNWSAASKTVAVDPSQDCITTPVLKFNVSTNGNKKTWCRITTTQEYGVDPTAMGFYKSGKKTGCGSLWFAGMGCSVVLDN